MSEPLLPATEPGAIITETILEPTTLGELAGRLPQSGLTFSFHPATMGTMRRLGALDADGKIRKVPGRYLAYYLGGALSELGGEDMGPADKPDKGAAKIAALPNGDVFTLMLAWKRHTSNGPVSLGEGACRACRAEFSSMNVDLDDINVLRLPAGAEPPAARVGLWHGFPFGGGQVRAVVVSPATWGETFGSLPAHQWSNPAMLSIVAIRGSISAVDTCKAPRVPLEALDEMMQGDAELIDEALSKISPVPELEVDFECPSCSETNALKIDWQDVGFFAGSRKG